MLNNNLSLLNNLVNLFFFFANKSQGLIYFKSFIVNKLLIMNNNKLT